jgi:hypothetical protein
MSGRQTLHQLVDELPEHEVPRAERVLAALLDAERALHTLESAPVDLEGETPEERAAVEEALREMREGTPGLTTEELEEELGLR